MRKQSINIYLTVLALYDNGVLIFSVLMLNLPAITEYQQMPAMYDNMEIVLSPDMLPSTPVADTPLAYRDSNLSSFDFVTGRSPDIDSSSLFMRVNDSSNQENDTDDPPRHYQLSSVKRWHKSFLHKSKQHQVRHGNLNQRAENFTDVKQNLENVLSEYYKREQLRLLRIPVLQCFNQTSVPDSAMTALPPSAPREIAYPRFNCSDCEDNPNVHMSEAVSRKLLIQMLRRTISYVSGNSDNGWESQVSSSPRRPQYSWKCQNSLLNLVGRYNKQSRQIESTSSSASTRLKTLHGVAFANTSLTDSAIDSEGEYLFSKNPMQHSLLRPNITSSSTLNFSAQEMEFEARTANSKSGSSSNLYPLVHYVKLVYPLALISQTGSIWTTCLITIERYLAVCHPLMSLTLSTRSRAIWALSLLSALAFLFNLPRFLEVDTTGGSVRPTDLRRNKVYYYVYYICLNLTFNYIVPLSLLSALNIKIYSRVRHANSHRNEMTTARQSELHLASMLVAIVAIFIACNAPAFLVHCLEPYFKGGSVMLETVTIFSNVLVCFNSAINFVIYCIFGKRFRSKLKQVLGLKRRCTILGTCCDVLLKSPRRSEAHGRCDHTHHARCYWNTGQPFNCRQRDEIQSYSLAANFVAGTSAPHNTLENMEQWSNEVPEHDPCLGAIEDGEVKERDKSEINMEMGGRQDYIESNYINTVV